MTKSDRRTESSVRARALTERDLANGEELLLLPGFSIAGRGLNVVLYVVHTYTLL